MDLEFLSPIIVAGAAAVLIVLERTIPYDRGQPLFRSGLAGDVVFYALAQSYLLGFVIFGIIHAVDDLTSVSRLQVISGWPIAWQVAASFIIHDFYIYWFHRLQHRSELLWRVHEAHHSNAQVDWAAGSRSHPLEILINQTIEFTPLVLLGGAAEAVLIKGMLDAVWGMYIHSNIDVRSGRLQYIINGPEMHRWHHAVDAAAHNRNFGTKLAVWDWIFGTAYRPESKPRGYGLGDEPYPRGYFRQVAWAFRRFGEGASGRGSDGA